MEGMCTESSIIVDDNLLDIEHVKFLEKVSDSKIFYREKKHEETEFTSTLEKFNRGKLPNGSVVLQTILMDMIQQKIDT
jgi:hypothetical protein